MTVMKVTKLDPNIGPLMWLEPQSFHSAGPFRFRIHGPVGTTGQIQRSPDLRTWTNWMPFTMGNLPLEISAPTDTASASRFFRAVTP
ncbi:MAG: hypothetical protein ACI9R3_006240 [Verrucomicrobiales bacterium]|jgi:hypothetical protein